ncbi:hypothetical protein QO002_003327 [Pararhizobium capsulatum DSM 1112]|uniref:Glycosyl transferase n=1 Tax=Pararhizobium capsulatum DSM 1112 TaxID=1121113 RepID=A0ABU0BU25_9HYPH|nr:glycosyl transferase [Pararhizobium capsulatum]MDQ0321189.1 hypothetical protein [Pararhizobium capsulatum DSM 1112]
MGIDRPFARKVWKLGSRLILGKKRAHAQDWLPHLRLEQRNDDAFDAIRFRGQRVATLTPLDEWKQLATNEIFVVGSGPSIKSTDVSKIPPHSAVLLNGAMALMDQGLPAPLAIAVEDERFVYRHFERFLAPLRCDIPCLLSVAVMRAICELKQDWLAERKILLIDSIAKPYGRDARSIDELETLPFVCFNGDHSAGFSVAPEKGVFQGGSVAVSAVQFAVACRPEMIGFVGVDISNADMPRFYEGKENAAFSGIARAEERILKHLDFASEIAGGSGIAFTNFSRISALGKCGIPFSDRLEKS